MTPSATTNGTVPTINDHKSVVPPRLFSLSSPPPLSELQKLTSRTTSHTTYPLASAVTSNIPVYDLSAYSPTNEATTSSLQDEWNHILLSGPGVLILCNFLPSPSLINTVNTTYASILSSSRPAGDHFAAAGSNSRIWNSFQKHALHSPSSFITYYSNPWLSHIATSYLGPFYQLTAQLNIVHPSGAAQFCHRDYHLGFQSRSTSAQYPRAMHAATALLTLQGAIAHSDMPLESGPTRFLAYSQLLPSGFLDYQDPLIAQFFEDNCVALPLSQGDAVFFSPALFHAAGTNTTSDFDRSANLLQISSAFSRTMESIDTLAIIEATWEFIVESYKEQGLSLQVMCAVQAVGSGYAFPTNLDRRPPAPGGMAPESEQDLMVRGLKGGWGVDEVVRGVREIREKSRA